MPQIDTNDQLNNSSKKLIGIAFNVYNTLGPGFAERIYQNLYSEILKEEGIEFVREKWTKLMIRGKNIGGHRIDFLIEDEIVVELKCRGEIFQKDIAQVLNYLKVNSKRLGLILCFTRKGVQIKRLVN